jgi:hypothetical protein
MSGILRVHPSVKLVMAISAQAVPGAGAKLAQQTFAAGATSIDAGRLGNLEVRGSEIILDAPLLMNKSNIDRYDF